MNTQYKGFSWEERTEYENELFEDCDFTDTVFDHVVFKTVTFKNCLFVKSVMNHIKIWSSSFINCKFVNVDLRNMPMGANGGLFEDCLFQKCDFRGQYFWYPFFNRCVFERCKLKGINFNDTSFHYCKFIGKIEDVTFNGIYHEQENTRKALDYVDFEDAIFGEYVGFENCDLSTSIAPKGKTFKELLYIVDMNDLEHLSTGSKDRFVIPKRDDGK